MPGVGWPPCYTISVVFGVGGIFTPRKSGLGGNLLCDPLRTLRLMTHRPQRSPSAQRKTNQAPQQTPRVWAPPSQTAGLTINQVVTAPAATPPIINQVFVETPLLALLMLSTSE